MIMKLITEDDERKAKLRDTLNKLKKVRKSLEDLDLKMTEMKGHCLRPPRPSPIDKFLSLLYDCIIKQPVWPFQP